MIGGVSVSVSVGVVSHDMITCVGRRCLPCRARVRARVRDSVKELVTAA